MRLEQWYLKWFYHKERYNVRNSIVIRRGYREQITYAESETVPVEDLVGHTASRILEIVDPPQFEQLDDKQVITLRLKTGM